MTGCNYTQAEMDEYALRRDDEVDRLRTCIRALERTRHSRVLLFEWPLFDRVERLALLAVHLDLPLVL